MKHNNYLAFVVPPSSNRRFSLTSSQDTSILKPSRYLNALEYANQFSKFVSPKFEATINFNFGNNGKLPYGSGPPNGTSSSGGRPHRNQSKSSYPQQKIETSKIRFSSGIKSGTLVNKREGTSSVEYSNTFIMGGSFFEKLRDKSFYSETLFSDVYYKYLVAVQQKVNVNVYKQFTQKSFFSYIHAVSSGLQLFYEVESILGYCSNNSNLNVGMTHLRNSLSSDVLSQHERLRIFLIQCPIPRMLSEFICYMYSNFTFSTHPNSNIYRLSFRDSFHNTSKDALSYEYYDVIINEIMNCNETQSLLLKTFNGMSGLDLPKVSDQLIYDQQFMTFWYNSCLSVTDFQDNSILNYTRNVSSYSQSYPYFQFTDEDIDGLFYACSSYYSTTFSTIDPGIWSPITDPAKLNSCDLDQQCSLLCYDGESKAFTVPFSSKIASQSGLFNSVYYNRTYDSWEFLDLINPSIKKVQTNSLENLCSSVTESILLLMGM